MSHFVSHSDMPVTYVAIVDLYLCVNFSGRMPNPYRCTICVFSTIICVNVSIAYIGYYVSLIDVHYVDFSCECHICLYLCVNVSMYVYVCFYHYLCKCVFISMHVNVCVYMCVFASFYVCECVCVYMCVFVPLCE